MSFFQYNYANCKGTIDLISKEDDKYRGIFEFESKDKSITRVILLPVDKSFKLLHQESTSGVLVQDSDNWLVWKGPDTNGKVQTLEFTYTYEDKCPTCGVSP
jgi:hypothetical protein